MVSILKIIFAILILLELIQIRNVKSVRCYVCSNDGHTTECFTPTFRSLQKCAKECFMEAAYYKSGNDTGCLLIRSCVEPNISCEATKEAKKHDRIVLFRCKDKPCKTDNCNSKIVVDMDDCKRIAFGDSSSLAPKLKVEQIIILPALFSIWT